MAPGRARSMQSGRIPAVQRMPTIVKVEPLVVTENSSLEAAWRNAEKPVRNMFKSIVSQCKAEECLWTDEDFGPTPNDEDGARSFYADGITPPGYADPNKCSWVRPQYQAVLGSRSSSDDVDSELSGSNGNTTKQTFCTNGMLFRGGASSTDVVQGRLGDCWFLGGLSVLATRVDLLRRVLWGCDDPTIERQMTKYGIRVCRFYKDCEWYYVFIDDQLPVFESGKPVFAHSRDVNELWVPFIEKAYAKLHGSYDSLIGGYIDGAVKDLTGLISEEAVLREGHMGYHKSNGEALRNGKFWEKLDRYANHWGCLMGCSIQPDPPGHGQRQTANAVEHEIPGTGLMMRHAYALVDVGEITAASGQSVRLVRLRNPWGFGEWTGPWSDTSSEFRENQRAIEQTFSGSVRRVSKFDVKNAAAAAAATAAMASGLVGDEQVTADEKDGTFFMCWEDWCRYFTVFFAAIDFPDRWSGQRVEGEWRTSSSGGNNNKRTWVANPKIRFRVPDSHTTLFLSLYQDDPRLVCGKNQAKFQDPLGFHILPDPKGGKLKAPMDNTAIQGSLNHDRQASYKLHLSVDLYTTLDKGDYVLVPSTYFDNRPGKYFVSIYSDKAIAVENAVLIAEEEEESGKHLKLDFSQEPPAEPTRRDMREAKEFEIAKEQFIATLREYGIPLDQVKTSFEEDGALRVEWSEWYERFHELGLPSHDISQHLFEIFAGEDGAVDNQEFHSIFAAELDKHRILGKSDSVHLSPSSSSADPFAAPLLGDEALPSGPGLVAKAAGGAVGPDHPVARLVHELLDENDGLRREMKAMRDEQARMMHVLLLYGKMLKCYEGPVYPPETLAKTGPSGPKSARARFEEAFSGYAELQYGEPVLGGRRALGASASGSTIATRRPRRGSFGGYFSEFEFVVGGDEFLAVKPWKGTVKPPSKPPALDASAPAEHLALDWVHGYAGQTSRSNVVYNKVGQVVYHAAGLGIVLDSQSGTQVYHRDHTDDVVSLAVHPALGLVATGQIGSKPAVHVWDSATGALRCRLLTHKRGVPALAFSATGDHLLSVGDDDNHTVALWASADGSWKDGKLVTTKNGSKSNALFVCPIDPGSSAGDGGAAMFAVGGHKHLTVWTWAGEVGGKGQLKSKKGKFQKEGVKVMPSATSFPTLPGFTCTGTSEGQLLVWNRDRCLYSVKAHEGVVNTLYAVGETIISGAKDGAVKLWKVGDQGKTLDLVSEFGITKLPHGMESSRAEVNALCWDVGNKKLVVGTKGSEIIEFSSVTEGNFDKLCNGSTPAEMLIQGHFQHELWGLCTHPSNPDLFITTGDDKTMRLWSIRERRQVQLGALPDLSRAVDWSADGEMVALGLGGRLGGILNKKVPGNKGGVVLLSASDFATVKSDTKLKGWVSDIKFSPDGSRLAVGGHDRKVHLYDGKTLRKDGVSLSKSSSSITHVDWSANSNHIQTNDTSYELLYYNAKTGSQITSPLKDETWASWTCSLGWPVQGVWPPESDGTDVNSVHRSNSGKLLVTGDDFSQVKVFRYPCVQDKSDCNASRGHSSHVTNVRFSCDDKYVLSTGGNDRCVMQWKVVM